MMTRRAARVWLPLVAGVLLTALVVASCGSTSDGSGGGSYGGGSYGGGPNTTPPATPAGDAVTIRDMSFSPSKLTVTRGTTVTWTNDDGVGHTVTSADGPGTDAATTSLFDSGMLGQGESFSYTFDEPGTYDYLCTLHATTASMHAEIVVE